MSFSYKDKFVSKVKDSYKEVVKASDETDKVMVQIGVMFNDLKRNLKDELMASETLNIIVEKEMNRCTIQLDYVALEIYRQGNRIVVRSFFSKDENIIDTWVYQNGRMVNNQGNEFSIEVIDVYLKEVFDEFLSTLK